jgi:beta-glucanase (GH16 family)
MSHPEFFKEGLVLLLPLAARRLGRSGLPNFSKVRDNSYCSHKRILESHLFIKEFFRILLILCTFSSCSCKLLDNLKGSDATIKHKHISINTINTPIAHKSAPDTINWKIAFDDEFDAPSLNTTTWNIQDDSASRYHNCCLSVGTGEQYFTAKAISLTNGYLQIVSNQEDLGGKSYTSGAITTENKYSFLYGDVEIRARLPQGQGMWPALWLLNADASREIDMMEMVSNPTQVYQTYHDNIPVYNNYQYQCIVKVANLSTAFHVYSLLWNNSSITWYIDGEQTCQITNDIPQTPMYLLLDTAVGGNWPGPPDASTIFPQYTEVNYVRVYQPPASVVCTGLLVSSPLQLANTSITRGGTLQGSVTYTNWCTTPFSLNDLFIATRKSDGSNADFGHHRGITLQSGQSITINASLIIQIFNPSGQWYAFSCFETPDGKWHGDETNLQFFTVT